MGIRAVSRYPSRVRGTRVKLQSSPGSSASTATGQPSGVVVWKHREEYVFNSPNGGMLRPPSSQAGWFDRAVKQSGLPRLSPHDLRHTTASLAVQAGANVKALQRMLGHASAAMTLDRYADLFDEDLIGVADALDAAAARLG